MTRFRTHYPVREYTYGIPDIPQEIHDNLGQRLARG